MTPKTRFNTVYFFIAALGIIFLHDALLRRMQVPEIPYSQFQKLLGESKVKEVVISQNHLRGVLKQPGADGKTRFITTRVEPDLAKSLEGAGITYRAVLESNFLRQLLAWTIPTLIFFGVWWLLARKAAAQMGGGFMALGKSKAKVYVETDTKVTFADVAGVEEAKEELVEIVDFLKDPRSHGRLGGRMPKGVLLVGPPGTGKTLLAKAVAGQARVPFFSISGSEFVEMFVGVGAARVRDLFEQARAKAPAIIFIDELDALGRARTSGLVGGHDEKEQTLNQLLVELDGFDSGTGLVLLAATNRPEILDPALLRAGRFDRQVLVDRPDKAGRSAILKVHLKKIALDAGMEAEEIAGLTPGFTGADLANLVNEAALVATRRKAEKVTKADFTAAIERIVAGLEKKNRLLNPREREIVAHHEMGHALVAAALPNQDPVHKISIIPRGIGALGYTMQRPTEDRYLMTREELENRMAVLLGGRAAEYLFFNHLSTGAADDLAKATDIARNMATRYGMADLLGHAVYDHEPRGHLGPGLSPRNHSEDSARSIDGAVRDWVGRAFERALAILNTHRKIAETGAQQLLAKETLDEEDLKKLFAPVLGVQP
ncbi:MAG: ATP-dependent zinc metalloprotease FtsH [Elusimicrobia bacterium]|nr:ATP-dependent zinc metalloprotease FtsH [Elusimicrobiota bacterium]